MTSTSLLEQSDHWVLPLSGEVVVQCRYDYAFTLVVGESDPSFLIRISDKFAIHLPGGSVGVFNPEADPPSGYEPWELSGPNGLLMVANTDGELVVWS